MTEVPEQGDGLGLGERLRRAREDMGRSAGDMAEELRLTAEQVHALEAEDFHRLPGEAYVRGYLRNYAAALGLPPDDVMAAYDQGPAGGGEDGGEGDSPLIPEPERPLIEHPWRVVWASLALLVVVSVVTVWLVGESQGPRVSEQTGPPAESPAEAPDPDQGDEGEPEAKAQPAAGSATGSEATSPKGASDGEEPADGPDAPAAGATDPGASGPAVEGPSGPRFEGPTLAGPGLEGPDVPQLSAGEGDQAGQRPEDLQTLRVHTWAKSWLEVADDRGRVLLRRLVSEGRDVRLYGQAPFQVKVGNAAGVQLYYEDRPLPPLGRPGQVVRLNVDADSRTIPESDVAPPEALEEARQAGAGATEPRAGAEGEPRIRKEPEGSPKTQSGPADEAPTTAPEPSTGIESESAGGTDP